MRLIYRTDAGRRRAARPAGFTLVEMLVTIAVTLLLMLAIVNFFEFVGESARDGRAGIEMAGPLRGTAMRLQTDLDLVTVPLRPWPNPASGLGYFEYYEGSGYDDTSAATNLNGDWDDLLMFTVRSAGEPFVGQLGGSTITSYDAEVVWWVKWDDLNGDGVMDPAERVLRRRVLLVRPDLSLSSYVPASFFNSHDISARPNAAGTAMVANSLADLTQRENRFGHDPRVTGGAAPTFPFRLNAAVMDNLAQTGNQLGEDIMLSNILAFDVRAYDPTAVIKSVSGLAVIPGDPGWTNATATAIGLGCFVDLNYTSYSGVASSIFSGAPQTKSQLHAMGAALPVMATYDTWSWAYERDGVNQNGGLADRGTDGLDNDNINGVDDPSERDTSPPYLAPLRGLQVRIRIYEPDTRQVRQVSVTSVFVPD